MTLRQISVLACWVAILASFVLSFGTWLALGTLAGFGVLAVAMPLAVDGYVVTTLTIWLSPEVEPRAAWLAQTNLYGVGVASVIAQASYHGWLVGSGTPGKAALAVAVGALPPVVATLAVHLRARANEPAKIPTPQPARPTPDQSSEHSIASPLPAAQPATRAATIPASASAVRPAAVQAAVKPAPHKVEKSRSPSSGNGTDLHDVRRMLAEGATTEQIAARLHVSKRTATRRIAAARSDRRLVGVS